MRVEAADAVRTLTLPSRFRDEVGPVRCVRQGDSQNLCFNQSLEATSSKEYSLEQWRMLDDRQCRCVRKFISFMLEVTKIKYGDDFEAKEWQRALASHWEQFV